MRKISLLTAMIMAGAVAGCATQPVQTAASMSAACSGDDYVEVTNNTGKAVDVYADVGRSKDQYIGTMPPDGTHLSLRGTPAEAKAAVFYAEVDGVKVEQGDNEGSAVQLIRRCGR